MKTTIHISFDFSFASNASFAETKESIGHTDTIHTTCLNFFHPQYLDLGCKDVIVYRQDGKMISLSELLQNNRPYCSKHILKTHDTSKMLMAGAFEFLNPQSSI